MQTHMTEEEYKLYQILRTGTKEEKEWADKELDRISAERREEYKKNPPPFYDPGLTDEERRLCKIVRTGTEEERAWARAELRRLEEEEEKRREAIRKRMKL